MNDPAQLLSIFLDGALGRSGRKRARKAARFLSGHRGLVSASGVLAAAGVAWGIYDSLKDTATTTNAATGVTPGAAGATVTAGAGTGAATSAITPPPLPTSIPFEVLRIVRLAVSAARADGELSAPERALILEHARKAGVEREAERELDRPHPLAEIVKVDPKAIGVGQYQHDVDQPALSRALETVVEDAVNAVGVDVNTASAALLSHVSGIGPSLADAIVAHRDKEGPFKTRRALLKVPRLGPKAFEQCAGFLRIRDGKEPLDASAVHPEAYGVAKKIVAACGRDVRSLMADSAALKALDPRVFVDERFGLPTVRDILLELEKPGRDPRPEFRTAAFADGVNEIADLKPGMVLEGTVTNVAAFGAFVDIGVHQDGLVHISALSDRYVKDPREVVKAGDIVKVKVLEVDVARKRIALTRRMDDEPGKPQARPHDRDAGRNDRSRPAPRPQPQAAPFNSAMADALKGFKRG